MAQTKQDKQKKAVNRLQAQLWDEQQNRHSLQMQSYKLIEPSDNEIRLSAEIHSLQVKLGMTEFTSESPF